MTHSPISTPFRASLLLFCLGPIIALAQLGDVRDFGAVADGKTLNTAALQRAIDKCAADGGGVVRVPAGTFLTGTLRLKSNLTLRLLPGAVLQGSSQPEDYPEQDIGRHKKFGTIVHDGLHVKTTRALLIGDGLENVSIVGEGAIRGAGDAEVFQLGINNNTKPLNVVFIGCAHVRLSGIRVLNSAQVTISISGCDRVFLDGLHVQSLTNWNCDGIDLDARDATVSNCLIESEDDALCLKSEYQDRFCENIVVTNCVVASICNGLKLGTGSRTGFRNVTVSNCVIRKTSVNAFFHPSYDKMTPNFVLDEKTTSVNSGIVILGVDGGLVENICFSDIVMTDVLSPIFIRVGRRFLNAEQKPSVMRHIRIRNVTAHTRSVIPSIIAGLDDSPATDIELTDFPFLALDVGAEGRNGLSWTASGAAIPAESKPSAVYRRLFVQGTPAEVGEQVRRLREGRSILDSVADRARTMQRTLVANDRDKLDQYFSSVRELEQRLVKNEDWEQQPKPRVTAPAPTDLDDPGALIERTRLMFQLTRLALETDSTRIVTIKIDENNNPRVNLPGVTQGHHSLTHHGSKEDKIEELKVVETAQLRVFGELLAALKTSRENGRSLLDHTMLLHGSNLGNANSHDNRNLPILLAGGGFKHGQHLAFDAKNNAPLPNLFVTMLQRLGVEAEKFATSTGTLRGLEIV